MTSVARARSTANADLSFADLLDESELADEYDGALDDIRPFITGLQRKLAVSAQRKDAADVPIDDETSVAGRRLVLDGLVVVKRGDGRWKMPHDESRSSEPGS